MIPAWVLTTVVVVLSAVVALWIGSTLGGQYDAFFAGEMVVLALICVLCAASNNFPLLLAFASWTPISPPLPGFRSPPAIATVMVWMAAVLFLRMSLTGTIAYRRSYSWFLLLVFAWVPIRFFMNPIHQGGGGSGGSGVSGIAPYLNYVIAGVIILFIGAVIPDRDKVIKYFRWCFFFCTLIGIILLICAFIPSTQPVLVSLGFFAAGNIGDNIQRLVVLPGYGLFLVEVAFCPVLFGLRWWQCGIVFTLGFVMIIVGGNRSALVVVPLAVPLLLFLRGKTNALIASVAVILLAVGALRVSISSMDEADIPALARCFGVFDEKIDDVSGGNASAQWRYDVWLSGLQKIAENPLIGKGYGNLPQHLNPEAGVQSTDYETILASGLAHNGFVSAAYGFGVPFAAALSLAILWLTIKDSIAAMRTDRHDPLLRELHAFLATMFASYPLLIFTAFDLSSAPLWTYAAISYIVSRLPKAEIYPASEAGPLRKYGEETRTAAGYNYRPY